MRERRGAGDEADAQRQLLCRASMRRQISRGINHLSEICSKPQYGRTQSPAWDAKFLRTTYITKGAVDWSSVPYCMDAPDVSSPSRQR